MRTIFTISLAAAFAFTSCKKCAECSFTYDEVAYSSGEFCGTPSEVNNLVEGWEKDAQSLGTIATCTTK